MIEAQTWRELLGRIIQNTHEKQRIASELGINQITLARWTNGTSTPRTDNLQGLLNALPEHREQLRILLSKEYNGFIAGGETSSTDLSPEISSEIPSAFYARVLNCYQMSPKILRSSTIAILVLQQMLNHLDPDLYGMKITMVECVPSDRQMYKVRSLRATLGRATSPWSNDLEYQRIMLGVESLPGYAIASGQMLTFNDPALWRPMFPSDEDTYACSVVASPIMRVDRVAGCVTVASTQPNYFTRARLNLIRGYIDLLLLAFEDAAFYPLDAIELGVMPPSEKQLPILQSFQHRVMQVLRRSAGEQQPIDHLHAEKLVWSQLEKELLEKSLDLANNN